MNFGSCSSHRRSITVCGMEAGDISLPALPVTWCVMTCKWLSLFEPQLLHRKMQIKIMSVPYGGFAHSVTKWTLHVKPPTQCWPQGRCSLGNTLKKAKYLSSNPSVAPCCSWGLRQGTVSFWASVSPRGANSIMPSLPPAGIVASPQFLRTWQWTWVITTQLLCISEWLALNFINKKEGDCPQGIPEAVSSPRASLHMLLSKPYWSGAAETCPNARLSFSLLNLGNALWPPHITLVSQASVLRHFVSKQFFARAWAQRWPGADLKWTPVPNAHSLAPLYMSWH